MLKVELEEYRSKIMCHCGSEKPREVVLKTCPHFFCKKCIDDTQLNRNRKCPICAAKFGKTDILEIVWS
jgi:E3 ubiquitin-protein ligase BRE1